MTKMTQLITAKMTIRQQIRDIDEQLDTFAIHGVMINGVLETVNEKTCCLPELAWLLAEEQILIKRINKIKEKSKTF